MKAKINSCFILQSNIKYFLQVISVEKNISNATICAYNSDLQSFGLFLFKNKIIFNKINRSYLLDYCNNLLDRKLVVSTINRKVTVLRQFFIFLYKEKRIDYNFADCLVLSKINRKLPNYLSFESVSKLLDFEFENKSFYGARLSAMLEILYSSGVRVSELVGIRLIDINIKESYIRVRGKGAKERLVLLNNHAINSLENYLSLFIKKLNDRHIKIIKEKQPLFPSSLKSYLCCITRQRVGQLLKNIQFQPSGNLNPDGNIQADFSLHPHMIRHSFATHLLDNDMDIKVIQDLLGHSDISTTQIYTSVAKQKVRHALNSKHPLGGMSFFKSF